MRNITNDTLGIDGTYIDPLWRVEVRLTPIERQLLVQPEIRRLQFVAHGGASSIATTQQYSRLEHCLGVLALVAHFRPDDQATRVAALLHDVGHLPLSHTLEGLFGLDHHKLGIARVQQLGRILGRGNLSATEILSVIDGDRASPLHNRQGALRLDHLDSFMRSGRSHGRTEIAPHTILNRLQLHHGAVSTDVETARYLETLIVGEAQFHLSELNVISNAIARSLVSSLATADTLPPLDELSWYTDDRLWQLLLHSSATRERAELLRENPLYWRATDVSTDSSTPRNAQLHVVRRLYLDPPLVDGRGTRLQHPTLPSTPVTYLVEPR